jgi:hypothetical protein
MTYVHMSREGVGGEYLSRKGLFQTRKLSTLYSHFRNRTYLWCYEKGIMEMLEASQLGQREVLQQAIEQAPCITYGQFRQVAKQR